MAEWIQCDECKTGFVLKEGKPPRTLCDYCDEIATLRASLASAQERTEKAEKAFAEHQAWTKAHVEKVLAERDSAIARMKTLENDVAMLESDCADGTCHACVRCCDAALAHARELTEQFEIHRQSVANSWACELRAVEEERDEANARAQTAREDADRLRAMLWELAPLVCDHALDCPVKDSVSPGECDCGAATDPLPKKVRALLAPQPPQTREKP